MKIVNGNIIQHSKGSLILLAHLNTRGGLKGNKIEELGVVLDKHKPTILGVSEINYDERDSLPTSKLDYNFIPGFTYSNQKTRVGIFVRRGIVCKVRKDISKKMPLPCVWLDVQINGEKLAIVNCYREFKKYKTDDSEQSEHISEQKKRFKTFIEIWMNYNNQYDEVFVLGDFNIDWGSDKFKDRSFKNMLQLSVLNKGYEQLIKVPTWSNTRGAVSIIDHIYTNSNGSKNVLNSSLG